MADLIYKASSLRVSVAQWLDDIMSNISIVKVNDDPVWSYKNNLSEINSWYLMGSPLPLLAITATYILFVLKIGPDFMKSRSPFKLNNVLLIYNTVQVIVSAWLGMQGILAIANHGLIDSECTTKEDVIRHLVTCMHYYLLAKVSELLDTVFFILRKKQRQVTFLHVYHHTIMLWNTWISIKYSATFVMTFLGCANSLVHVVMYTYYGLSAFPSLAKYLWWKKYLTALQLIQFVLVFLHAAANHFYGCPLSTLTMFIIMFNSTAFFILFGQFYIKAYSDKRGRTIQQKTKTM